VIIPGTKNTLDDLAWLRERGLDQWIHEQHQAGARIVGICGGYQMMGESVDDPLAVESNRGGANGLGLLRGRTVLASEKTTRRIRAVTPSGVHFDAYEIHLGVTTRPSDAEPFATLADGIEEGVRAGRCAGTYLHGAIEDPLVLGELVGRPIPPAAPREETYEALANWFEANVDLGRFKELYL
jgi:adenosylcobyric acid synthase